MSAQEQWRFCTNCGGLFYAGPGFGKGVCPARSGGHAKGKSHNYVLAYPPLPATDPAVTPQGNWRFCTKCGGLFFAGPAVGPGVCPAGGGHAWTKDSYEYFLAHDVPQTSTLQDSWWFCTKCGGLFYAGAGYGLGVCPAEHRGHDKGISYNYVLAHHTKSPLPPLPKHLPARLEFRLRFFHEYASNDGGWQGASDEVFIQGVGADSGMMVKGRGDTVDSRLISSPFVGDASDNVVRNRWRKHPHVLLEFDLRVPTPWPRTFTSTLNIVEEDSAGLLESFAKLEVAVKDEISEAITATAVASGALVGAAVGSSVPVLGTLAGAAIGAIGAAVYDAVIEEIKEGLGNEAFTPITRSLTVADLTAIRRHPDIGRELSVRVNEHGADYEIFYDWNLVG